MSTTDDDVKQSWLPMVIIAMGQTQMSLNINALPVSIGGIVAEFNVAPTTVGTAIVAYSLGVAGFIMLGAKLGQVFGSLRVFRAATLMLMIAVTLVTFSPNATVLILAQLMAGLAAAVIVPTLVVLIANNYRGKQQATCLGMLGSVQAAATVTAFFMAGVIGDLLSWRYAFGLCIPFTGVTLLLAGKLKPVPPLPGTKIDMVGVVLAAAAIILISFGFNNLNRWGLAMSGPNAPFSILGLSPAPVMIVLGVIGLQLFVAWTQRREAAKLTPLLSLDVLESRQERGAAFAMAMIVVLGNAMTFLSPLYIQMVQGRSSFDTAVAMIPYQAAVFAAAMLVVRFYESRTPIADRPLCLHAGRCRHGRPGLRDVQRMVEHPGGGRAGHGRHRPGRARHATVQRAGYVLAEGARGRRRGTAWHRQQPFRGGGYRHRRRPGRGHPVGEHQSGDRRPPGAPTERGGPGGPEQRDVRQQRPAGGHDGRHHGDARAGQGGGAGQRRRAVAGAETHLPAVELDCAADDRPGTHVARVSPG